MKCLKFGISDKNYELLKEAAKQAEGGKGKNAACNLAKYIIINWVKYY